MKTVKQWLESIADETVRVRALRNAEEQGVLDIMVSGLPYAIDKITWGDTEEGYEYWSDVWINADMFTLKTIEP